VFPEKHGWLQVLDLSIQWAYSGRCHTLYLMGKINLQEGKYAEALAHVQEAVTIFRETGSRHLPDAEATLKYLQERIEHA
jgi:hypothetical protein